MSAARAPRRIAAAPRSAKAAARVGDRKPKRRGDATRWKRRPVIALSGPGDGGVIGDPEALGTLAFDLLNDLNNHPNPLAKPTALFLIQTKGWLEFLGEVANARGKDFSLYVKHKLRDKVIADLGRDIGKEDTAKTIAKLIGDDAADRTAYELTTENPHDPGTPKYKARQILMFNGAVTIGAPRIDQILEPDSKAYAANHQ